MLYYTEAGISNLEVPGEQSLCIYISGCVNRCPECHYPELQRPDYGDPLCGNFEKLLLLYLRRCSCVCFLGEGENTPESRRELAQYAALCHAYGRRSCLYSGRDTVIEPWMHVFDYIKLGSYRPQSGPLDSPRTNQRMFLRTENGYTDITGRFRLPFCP